MPDKNSSRSNFTVLHFPCCVFCSLCNGFFFSGWKLVIFLFKTFAFKPFFNWRMHFALSPLIWNLGIYVWKALFKIHEWTTFSIRSHPGIQIRRNCEAFNLTNIGQLKWSNLNSKSSAQLYIHHQPIIVVCSPQFTQMSTIGISQTKALSSTQYNRRTKTIRV